MERSGELLAISTQEKLYSLSFIDKKVERISAFNSELPLIRHTAQFIQQHFHSFHAIHATTQLEYSFAQERQFVQILPFQQQGLDWLIVVVVPETDFMAQLNENTQVTIRLAVMALLISLLLSLLVSRWVVRPISYLNQAVQHLTQGTWTQLPLERNDELGELTRSFNLMAKQLKESFELLEEKVMQRTEQLAQANEEICTLNDYLREENQRMGMELEVTRKLQQMVLPRPEELRNIKPLDIAAFMEPASEVGGDYYDILQDNDRIKIGIGDVTGHGLESGVLMLMVQTAVRTLLSSQLIHPKDFLNILNRTLYDNLQRMQSDKNLTLSLLDYANGKLSLSGQHEEVLYVNQFGKVERIDTFSLGFMVGIEPDIAQFVAQQEIYLAPGDGIVLYTDGLTEAMDVNKRCYGLERLCDVVSRHWLLNAQDIQQAVISDLRRHIGNHKLQDDVTLLVIKQRAI
jgi:sigma-B regulation protein RsbU (phosphoserine phosphatase)